jgi:hypothetical protein
VALQFVETPLLSDLPPREMEFIYKINGIMSMDRVIEGKHPDPENT